MHHGLDGAGLGAVKAGEELRDPGQPHPLGDTDPAALEGLAEDAGGGSVLAHHPEIVGNVHAGLFVRFELYGLEVASHGLRQILSAFFSALDAS